VLLFWETNAAAGDIIFRLAIAAGILVIKEHADPRVVLRFW
jgi:hypothetical protein